MRIFYKKRTSTGPGPFLGAVITAAGPGRGVILEASPGYPLTFQNNFGAKKRPLENPPGNKKTIPKGAPQKEKPQKCRKSAKNTTSENFPENKKGIVRYRFSVYRDTQVENTPLREVWFQNFSGNKKGKSLGK